MHRLYEDALKAIAVSQPISNKPGQQASEQKEEELVSPRRVNEVENIMEYDQTCDEFVKIMDQIRTSKL